MTSNARWKRRILYALGIGAVLAGALVAAFYYSAHHVPDFYREALEDTNVTVASAQEFQERTTVLLERMEESPDWTESFTEQQINSWLAYEFPRLDHDWVPQEVSQPRVRFEAGKILTACRYDGEDYSGVLSLEIRPRVTETRDLVLEVISAKAGILPIPLDRVLEELPEQNELQGFSMTVAKIDGRDALRISHDSGDNPSYELTKIEVEEEQITLSGKSRYEERPRLSRLPNQSGAASEFSN